MDLPRLEHVRVSVRDFPRALAWYESVLERCATGHWPVDDPKYAHFDTGGAQFALSELPPNAGGARFNFSVADVDAWWDRLRHRTDVLEPLHDTTYGTRKFTIRDPDGNELGFVREDRPAS